MTPDMLTDAGPEGDDALELELRQLTGVLFVSLVRRQDLTLVELVADPGIDAGQLGSDARRVAVVHVEGPLQIEIVDADGVLGSGSGGRVRLLLTVPLPGRPAVELHLAHQDRRVRVEASTEDAASVARAVVDGLRRLGLPAAYDVVSAHGLAEELGAGILVVLRDQATGGLRRGLATGRDGSEATARAVLNALNRSLHPVAGIPRT